MSIQTSPTEVILQIEERNNHSHEIVERKQVTLTLLKHKVQLTTQTAKR